MRTLCFATLTVLTLAGCRGGESSKPPVNLIRGMMTQEKAKAYRRDTSGLFADGRTMRLPVEGTVAQGQLEDDALLYEGLDDKGQPSQKFPDAVKQDGVLTDAFRARGKARFEIYCAPCHGLAGDGKGPVAQLALDGGPRLLVAPPAYTDPRLKEMVVGKMYSAIKNGVNAGNMPSYAVQIPVDDRWAILAYIRALQRASDPAVSDEGGVNVVVAKATVASAEHGALLYKAKTCNACHSIDGTRVVGPSFKGIYGKKEKTSAGEVDVNDEYLKESMLQPMAKIVDTFPPAMPTLPLDPIEVQSLILYIATLK
jgi:mono/diheme cytochrome c family protein